MYKLYLEDINKNIIFYKEFDSLYLAEISRKKYSRSKKFRVLGFTKGM